MNFLKRRLPQRNEIFLVFSAVIFAVFAWTIQSYLFKTPSFILYYGLWDLISILAYLLSFALIESLLVVALVVALAAFLPGGWLKEGFGYKGFITILTASIYAIYIKDTMTDQPSISYLLRMLCTFLIFWIGILTFAHFWPPLQRFILSFADRLSIFIYIFLPLGAAALFIVFIRLVW